MLWTKPEVQAYYDLTKQKPKEHTKVIATLELTTKALPEFHLCTDEFLFVFSV
jgi:hypothetical protein